MPQDPLEIWNRVIPESTVIALRDVAHRATAEAYALCKTEYPNYPIAHITGQNRFTKLQYRMLEFGHTDPVLKSKPLSHPNKLPFTQLYAPQLQITSATLEYEHAFPQLSFFREAEQAQQLRFFKNDGVLICHLCICVGSDLSVPRLVQIQFPDGKDGYLEQFVDLTNLTRRTPLLPVEPVRDNLPRERGRETNTTRDDG